MPEYTAKAMTLCPVHIGGGQDHLLDPLDYVVKNETFYRINVEKMLEIDPCFAKQFATLTDRGMMVELRKSIVKAFDPSKRDTWQWKAGISDNFARSYNMCIDDTKNQLLVQCLPRSTATAYLPGSSIKGAIRTALLDRLAAQKPYEKVADIITAKVPEFGSPDPRRKTRALTNAAKWAESISLDADKTNRGQIKPYSDPFKALKIGDAILPENCTRIEEIYNVPKGGEPNKMSIFVETVKPDTEFSFSIVLEDVQTAQRKNIRNPITYKSLIADTHEYFMTAIKEEEERFYADEKITQWIDKIFATDEEDNSNQKTVVRVGRFSHLESMTYNSPGVLRVPNPPRHPRTNRPKPWGTTRNLVDGYTPLGFIKVEIPVE